MTPRTKVLYLAHTFAVGGAEEMALNLVRHLPARFEPMVCCVNTAGPIGEEIRKTGVPFTVLGLNPGARRPWDVVRMSSYLRSRQPQIVHTFLLTASLYGRLAAILARIPIVIGTEVNTYERKRPHHVVAERVLMAGTDRVVASAESVRDFYIKQVHAAPGKVDVIYNAVDWSQLKVTEPREKMRKSIGVPNDALAIGIIARLTEQKAHRVLFDAMRQNSALSETHVVIVGDGELRADLQSRAEAAGLSRRTHFLGARRDLGNLLGAVDVFAMPSFWEGLPLSMVLAMGAGLPVVATRVAGIPEVVQDESTGLLVSPGDSVGLGNALARLVGDSSLRARLGEAGRAFVLPRFGVDEYVRSVASLYDRLLAEQIVQ